MFKMLLASHGEPAWMPNIIPDLILVRADFTDRIYTEFYEKYGYETTMFLINSGKKFVLMFVMLAMFPFIRFMDNRYADKHPYCKLWTKIRAKFTYSMPLRIFLLAYVSFTLTSTLNIMEMPLETFEDNFSALCALSMSVVIIYSPVFLLHLFQKNYTVINTIQFQNMYSSIIRELKTDSPIQYMYYPFFLIRRALFAMTLVILADSPRI